MKKYLFIVLLVGVGLAQKTAVTAKGKDSDENLFNYNAKEGAIQIGRIDEFVLDQGYPFKKESVFGEIIIQQGRLDGARRCLPSAVHRVYSRRVSFTGYCEISSTLFRLGC